MVCQMTPENKATTAFLINIVWWKQKQQMLWLRRRNWFSMNVHLALDNWTFYPLVHQIMVTKSRKEAKDLGKNSSKLSWEKNGSSFASLLNWDLKAFRNMTTAIWLQCSECSSSQITVINHQWIAFGMHNVHWQDLPGAPAHILKAAPILEQQQMLLLLLQRACTK